MRQSRIIGTHGLTVLAVGAFLAALGWLLGRPGYGLSRLVLFAGLGGFAIAGAAGVVYERPLVAVGSACGLFLLGFWQAVLWIYIFPVAGLLVVAAVRASHGSVNTPVTG